MQSGEITAVLERKRELHPELARPLTWPGLERICGREGVRIAFQRIPRDAQLVPFLGGWTIVLNKDLHYRRHTYRAAHELGHLWLHHDLQHDRTERVYNMDTDWPDDPREDDAELFATLVLSGPHRANAWTKGIAACPPQRPSAEAPTRRIARVPARIVNAGDSIMLRDPYTDVILLPIENRSPRRS